MGEKRNILCERRTAGGNILGQIKEGQRGRGGRRGKRGRAAASTVELSRVEEGTKRWFLYNPFTAAALSRVIVPRRRDVLWFRAALREGGRLWGRRWAPSSSEIWYGRGGGTKACHRPKGEGEETCEIGQRLDTELKRKKRRPRRSCLQAASFGKAAINRYRDVVLQTKVYS